MSEVRNVQITGGAVDHYRKERAGGSTRRKRKEYQDGGDVPPGVPITGAANISAARVIQNSLARGGAAKKDESVVIRKTHVPSPSVSPTASAKPEPKAEPKPEAKAEAKPEAIPTPKPAEAKAQEAKAQEAKPKLLLHPPKKTPKKIVLAPPAISKPKKRSRDTHKVKVQLSGFKKRVTRAKAISKESSQKPLADVRKELEEAKLIKPLPKDVKERVPEPVLRSMHRDYLLLRNRAL
jgi:hypothetical protein